MLSTRTRIRRSEVSDEVVAPRRRMTEQEFVDWCDADTWAEWVDGEVIVMAPVGLEHADAFGFLYHLMRAFVEEHRLGKVLSDPYQVRFAKMRRRRSPDIFFVSTAHLAKLKSQYCEGAPDLVIEVISPSSQSRDRRDKFFEYQNAGVREYWIVDPLSRSLEAYALKRKVYQLIEETNGVIASTVLPRFYLKSDWHWQTQPPVVSDLLKEMSAKR